MIWLFDIDGTLIRSGGAGGMAMSFALQEVFGAAPHTKGVSFSGRTDYAITKDLFELHQIPFERENVNDFYECYLQRLPQTLCQCSGEVLPGVLDWIRKIDEAGCHLGLITGNMQAAAKMKLDHFQLTHHFSFGGYGDSLLNRNDVAAAAVNSATKHLRNGGSETKVLQTWVIGDTPHDISCARSQSLNSIGVATGSHSLDTLSQCQPQYALASLRDTQLLDKLLKCSDL